MQISLPLVLPSPEVARIRFKLKKKNFKNPSTKLQDSLGSILNVLNIDGDREVIAYILQTKRQKQFYNLLLSITTAALTCLCQAAVKGWVGGHPWP